MTFDIRIKRVYEPAESSDGQRVLVDRLWPRGVSKERAALALWLKEIAPSNELRHWYNHVPERWDDFRKRYAKELDGNPEPLRELGTLLEHGRVTLLYSTQEERYNNAVALAEYLKGRE